MADAGWTQYTDQICHRFNYETNDWDITNCCTGAMIYGADFGQWAKSGDCADLSTEA